MHLGFLKCIRNLLIMSIIFVCRNLIIHKSYRAIKCNWTLMDVQELSQSQYAIHLPLL